MNTLLREALDRTLALMRDDLTADVKDSTLIAALTDTEVALVGDARNLSSHSAQCAYITAALLMARSGHRVHLVAPDVLLIGTQPPLKGDRLISGLMEIGDDLLPGIGFSVGWPSHETSLSVMFGDSAPQCSATRAISVNASAWSAHLDSSANVGRWHEENWPFGGLAAGALASVEAFKIAMHRLRWFAKDALLFGSLFALTNQVKLDLAPPTTPRSAKLGPLDFVSGGAITNAALYSIARVPDVMGTGRIIEPESGDVSNLNRYMLLRHSMVGRSKAEILKSLMPSSLQLESVQLRYQGGKMPELGRFAPYVLVGVDDIPTRWKVQEQNPFWLGVGATSHWAAMASYHQHGLACARCLHPRDDLAAGIIPTIAFVSFFAGLQLACYFVRMMSGDFVSRVDQYSYFSPLRAERIWRSVVAVRGDCSICGNKKLSRAPAGYRSVRS